MDRTVARGQGLVNCVNKPCPAGTVWWDRAINSKRGDALKAGVLIVMYIATHAVQALGAKPNPMP